MARRALPIRARLTVWYFVMFTVAAALLSGASVWMLRYCVEAMEYHEMQERADDVRVVLMRIGPDKSQDEVRAEFAAIYDMKDDGKYLEVCDAEGNWLYRSKRMAAANLGFGTASAVPAAGRTSLLRQGNHSVRVLTYPISAQGRTYMVRTGLAVDRSLVLVEQFEGHLFLLAPLVIVVAVLCGHIMSRQALRPVASLAREAHRINAQNLDVRLPAPNARDEIASLSLELNQMLERISRAFTSIRTFTGNASHELRTPLGLLRTEIEVALIKTRSAEEYRNVLVHLHEETLQMTALVENLLALARADGGAEAARLAPVGVTALLCEAERTWQAPMKQAVLDFAIQPPASDAAVLADQASILRLLSILLENAMKFTPPGGQVRLIASTEAARVTFGVRDTGMGIASADLPHIFARFYRVNRDGLQVQPGSGLGLALARWIAEQHQTKLEVESSLKVGSFFSFQLDRAEAARSRQGVDFKEIARRVV